jgi:4-amino-4-deoxy-L-arabinose transferase-like glycosyltransferase
VLGPCPPSPVEGHPLPRPRSALAPSTIGRRHLLLLAAVAAAGAGVFLWGLGQTGLVDETPALFAASARHMAESGDWLIPQVNGLPRYDKPPLVYWLMASLYALPGASQWDPLGSWAARLPSAVATISTMVLLADTLWRWPQPTATAFRPVGTDRAIAALNAALAFALGPLVLVWGRTEVSDALFTATLAMSLLLAWRTTAADGGPWWPCWLALALAVLSKGPVALVLFSLTLAGFWLLGAEAQRLRRRLRPLRGLALSLMLAAPWYALALWREGQPYWESFFGYHNLQRYTRVVNNHQQGWWYFFAVLVLASLPFTPLLLLSLRRILLAARSPLAAPASLGRFAAAWLLAVLAFFSLSATKLPSYWLVATPAAALLVALALSPAPQAHFSVERGIETRGTPWALACSAGLLLLISAALAAAPLWLQLIRDPTIPDLQSALGRSPALPLGGAITLLSGLLLAGWGSRRPALRLLQSQAALLLVVPLVLLPIWQIGDQLRGAPIRELAAIAQAQHSEEEALAMVGLRKPSLHYYSRATVIFEGRSATALVNLADRLGHDIRPGLHPSDHLRQPTVLLLIDRDTARQPHWQGWSGKELAKAGPYELWRVDRRWLEERARQLGAGGKRPNWREPRPERF